MKSMFICFVLAAAVGCTFDPSGAPAGPDTDGSVVDDGDAGIDSNTVDAQNDIDAPVVVMPDASVDAMVCPSGQVATPDGCQPIPNIHCSLETDGSGIRWRRLEFTGWVTYGLLGAAPSGATPTTIAYGSDFDSSAVQSSCTGGNRWVVPYPAGCTGKASVAWAGEPGTANVLRISENVENFNIAVSYTDGTVRWADIKLDDGDPDGFSVSGSGSGYNCHIVHPGGVGGIIQVAP